MTGRPIVNRGSAQMQPWMARGDMPLARSLFSMTEEGWLYTVLVTM